MDSTNASHTKVVVYPIHSIRESLPEQLLEEILRPLAVLLVALVVVYGRTNRHILRWVSM